MRKELHGFLFLCMHVFLYYSYEAPLGGNSGRRSSAMISSYVKISTISLTSSLSIKLYLNSLVYHRNIFESSSNVLGNLQKFSENVRECSSGLRTILEIFGGLRRVIGNLRKVKLPSSVSLYNKKNITR